MQKFALDVRMAGITDRLAIELAGLKIKPHALRVRRYRYRKANGIRGDSHRLRYAQLSLFTNF